MNKAAQELGRLAKGKPKTLSQAERKRRADRLAEARKKRWPRKANASGEGRGTPRTLDPVVGSSGGDE